MPDICINKNGKINDETSSCTCAYSLSSIKSKRTMKKFSSAEESTMSKEVHANYFKYYNGTYKCTDQDVTVSFDGTSNDMPNGINLDFININFTGKEQVIKKGIVPTSDATI